MVSNGLCATPKYAEPVPGTWRGIITYGGIFGFWCPICFDTMLPILGWMFSSGVEPASYPVKQI